MDYVFIQAFVFGMIFAYISSSPFVLQEHYRLSPLLYSLCFAVNAIALIIGTTLAGRFRHIRQGMVTGVIGSFVLAVFTGLTLWYEMPIAYFETALFLNLIFGGLVLPTSTALALDSCIGGIRGRQLPGGRNRFAFSRNRKYPAHYGNYYGCQLCDRRLDDRRKEKCCFDHLIFRSKGRKRNKMMYFYP